MIQHIKNLDLYIFSAPLVACTTIGAGFNALENTPFVATKKIGWLGSRLCVASTFVAGVPLVVYSVAKLLFAALLNNVTFKKVSFLNRFQENCESRLNITIAVVGVTPFAIMNATPIIKAGYKAYSKYNEIKPAIDQVKNSEAFQHVKQAYQLLQNYLNSFNVQSHAVATV